MQYKLLNIRIANPPLSEFTYTLAYSNKLYTLDVFVPDTSSSKRCAPETADPVISNSSGVVVPGCVIVYPLDVPLPTISTAF